MGDTALTTPALALLQAARPDLRLFVAVERPWDELLDASPDLAGVIALDPGAGRMRAIAAVRRRRPELCLNLHGGPSSAWITALSGARWRAGFAHFAHRAVYNVRLPRAQEILGRATDAPVHTAEHLASAIFYLGVEHSAIPPARLFGGGTPPEGLRRPYAVLHVAAAFPAKQWPIDRFADLARWLERDRGLRPVLLTGPGQGQLLDRAKNFRGFDNLSVREMMALLKGADLFVGNDSGPAHVAAAFGVPCVVIFGPSDFEVWRPWRTRHQIVPAPFGQIDQVEVEGVRQAVAGVLATADAVRHG